LGLGVWLWAEPAQADAPAPLAVVTSVEPRPAGIAAPQTGAVMPAAKEEQPAAKVPSRELALPDGTSVPALNGAVDPAPLARFWGNFPWSPIVGTRQSGGVDWYEHADGSFSTTMMVFAHGLGREICLTRVAHPGPTPTRTAAAN
jgi:hypothetical protein